ncbi:MAG TPA: carboxypeptidase-like regulatory domain-containing protein [Pyrinomonadaceae bacterium]|nr:carboxypeptidase-like regulatory domain-containing protein [Pyrinomonadaceae bacterium]
MTVDRVGTAETGLRFRSVDAGNGWSAFTLNGYLYVDELVGFQIERVATEPFGANCTTLSAEFADAKIRVRCGTADIAIIATDYMNATEEGLYAYGPYSIYKFDNFAVSGAVSITGRVVTAGGQPINGAAVLVGVREGQPLRGLTNAFGNYEFDGLIAGQTYVVSADAKRYLFSNRTVTLTNDVVGFDLVGSPR